MKATLHDLRRDLAAGKGTWPLEAALAVTGIGRSTGQAHARRATDPDPTRRDPHALPFPVFRHGRLFLVPLLPLARALGVEVSANGHGGKGA